MLLTSDQLFHIPVETIDQYNLGHVVGLVIDIESQSIMQYRVRPTGIVANVLRNVDLLINRGQVISLTKDKMVVESTVLRDKESEVRTVHLPQHAVSFSATSSTTQQ
ncbi:MAG: hypothetical protein AB1352_03170 [Patescibacteria group bacterium]